MRFGPLLTIVACVASIASAKTGKNPNNTSTPDPAKIAADVAKIKSVIGAGLELAGAYSLTYDQPTDSEKIVLKSGAEYLTAVASSYIYADFNKDGILDLAVAVEKAPTIDSNSGESSFGDRILMVYLGGKSGKLTLAGQGPEVILSADEGGIFGDPFDGLRINSKNSLIVDHYGGSRDRWGIVQTFQFRAGTFYLIGQSNEAYDDLTLKGSSIDTNLLTGDRKITIQRGGNKPDRVVWRKVKVRPLVKMSDAKAEP